MLDQIFRAQRKELEKQRLKYGGQHIQEGEVSNNKVCRVNKDEGKEAERGIKHQDQLQGPGD